MDDNRLFAVSEIRECERFTIEKEQISSLGLMERAGEACAEEVVEILWMKGCEEVYVCVGTGNNGGDGVVIAIQLLEEHHIGNQVNLVVCAPEGARFSSEMEYQLQRWQKVSQEYENAHTVNYTTDNQLSVNKNDLVVASEASDKLGLIRRYLFCAVAHHKNDIRICNAFIDSFEHML